DRVGVTLDRHVQAGLVLHDLDGFVDETLAVGLERRLVEIELWPVKRDERLGLRGRRRRGRWWWRRGRRLLLRIADHVPEERADQPAGGDAAADPGATLRIGRILLPVVGRHAARDAADRGADHAAADRTGTPLPIHHGTAGRQGDDQDPDHQDTRLTHASTSLAVW